MNINRLIQIYRNTSDLLSELNDKRKHYNSFFEFHKATGLGSKYKLTKRKFEICEKLIFLK